MKRLPFSSLVPLTASRNFKKSVTLLILPLLLQVSCSSGNLPNQMAANVGNPQTSGQTQTEPVFQAVLSKRTLELSNTTLSSGASDPSSISVAVPSSGATLDAPMPAPSAAPTAYSTAAPSALPTDGPLSFASPIPGPVGYGYGSPGYGYGGEFNQYIPITAEELKFAGSSESDLKTVYNHKVKEILAGWDAQARLLESRGSSRPQDNPDYDYESISIPGVNLQELCASMPAGSSASPQTSAKKP